MAFRFALKSTLALLLVMSVATYAVSSQQMQIDPIGTASWSQLQELDQSVALAKLQVQRQNR